MFTVLSQVSGCHFDIAEDNLPICVSKENSLIKVHSTVF